MTCKRCTAASPSAADRTCASVRLALMEAPLILAAIAQRYRLLAMPGHRVQPEPMITLRVRGGLPMLVQKVT